MSGGAAAGPGVRRVLLTGGGGDIGAATAALLRADGLEVCRLSHQPGTGADIVADFADDDALEDAVRGIAEPIDGVVLCHGVVESGSLASLDAQAWRRVMDVNLNSVYTILHALSPRIADIRSIVVVASTAGLDRSRRSGPHYTVSKAAVIGLVRHLARDLGPLGVRINAVCPGHIRGRMADSVNTPATEAAGVSQIPLGRAGEPHEVATVIRYLLSARSSYVTGAVLSVAGGTHR